LPSQVAIGVSSQIVIEAASVAMHPAHHLHHQQACNQCECGLEPFAGRPVHGLTGKQDQHRQQAREHQPQHHTRPEEFDQTITLALLAGPGLENTDHQQRLDAFAPDDEH
jgi:hypothetical protein